MGSASGAEKGNIVAHPLRAVASPAQGGEDADGGSLRPIRQRRRDGLTLRQIAAELGHSPKTILKALADPEPRPFRTPPRPAPVFGPFERMWATPVPRVTDLAELNSAARTARIAPGVNASSSSSAPTCEVRTNPSSITQFRKA